MSASVGPKACSSRRGYFRLFFRTTGTPIAPWVQAYTQLLHVLEDDIAEYYFGIMKRCWELSCFSPGNSGRSGSYPPESQSVGGPQMCVEQEADSGLHLGGIILINLEFTVDRQ